MRAVVALGANLGEPAAAFAAALVQLEEKIGRIAARSKFYWTKALTLPGSTAPQPDYLNGVVLVETALAPGAILKELLTIEAALGRERGAEKERWAARLIDLDLILVDDLVMSGVELNLPHPRMHERDFVLVPLTEVWPKWRHPLLNLTAVELAERLTERSIKAVAEGGR